MEEKMASEPLNDTMLSEHTRQWIGHVFWSTAWLSVLLELASIHCPLASTQMFPGIQDEGKGNDNPQGIHEDKVEPEVDWVPHLAVAEAITVFSVEVENISIQLA